MPKGTKVSTDKEELFEGYERRPQEVPYEKPEEKGIVDWTAQLEKRSAQQLQKKNNGE